MQARYSEYPGVQMKGVLKKVATRLGKVNIEPGPSHGNVTKSQSEASTKDVITHDWLWPSLGQWLKEDDIVVTETGRVLHISSEVLTNPVSARLTLVSGKQGFRRALQL